MQSKTNRRDRGMASTWKSMTCSRIEQCSQSTSRGKRQYRSREQRKWTICLCILVKLSLLNLFPNLYRGMVHLYVYIQAKDAYWNSSSFKKYRTTGVTLHTSVESHVWEDWHYLTTDASNVCIRNSLYSKRLPLLFNISLRNIRSRRYKVNF